MKMNYTLIGEGEPVVLLHGFLENHKMWLNMANEIKGFQFILPDLLGHGSTPVQDEVDTMEDQARSVIELLKTLKISKATFIGHSMGGYIALAIARDYSSYVEKLGLFFSKTLADTEEKKEQRLEAIRLAKENKESFVRLGVRSLFDKDNLDHLSEEIATAQGWGMETPIEGIASSSRGMREREDTTYLLSTVPYPVLILLGEKDPAVENDYAERIPKRENIQVYTLPCGHMGSLEKPKESKEIIENFLKN